MEPSEAAELRQIVLAAAQHVFPAAGIPVGDGFEPTDDGGDDRKQLVAFMGFVGKLLRGTLAFVAPVDLMRQTYPIPLEPRVSWEFDVFDWSGEVANRLLANVKNGLAARGVEIEASTPRVILADQLRITRSVPGTVCSTCFASRDAWVKVWFDAVAPANQRVLGPVRPGNETPPEGDVMLF